MTGAEMIAAERQRQIDVEGYTPEHDDEYTGHKLAMAAVCYAAPYPVFFRYTSVDLVAFSDPWPEIWDQRGDTRHRSDDGDERLLDADEIPLDERIKDLVKAGALVAAEIDRLQRAVVDEPEDEL